MQIKAENSEVFYVIDFNVRLEKKDFTQLAELSKMSHRKRARFCTHKNKDSLTHEMFEIFTKETYLKPIKQKDKSYSFHIIDGLVDVILFSDDGIVIDIVSLGNYQSGKPFYFKAPENVYRTLITHSDYVLYHEVTSGPFKKEDTIFAPWAPDENDSDGIKTFFDNLNIVTACASLSE